MQDADLHRRLGLVRVPRAGPSVYSNDNNNNNNDNNNDDNNDNTNDNNNNKVALASL